MALLLYGIVPARTVRLVCLFASYLVVTGVVPVTLQKLPRYDAKRMPGDQNIMSSFLECRVSYMFQSVAGGRWLVPETTIGFLRKAGWGNM
jgi:hypothetical protein